MTFTHWYRDDEPSSSKNQMKITSTLNRLGYRLTSAISEARSLNNLYQPAGLDRPMSHKTKGFRKKGGGVPRVFKHKLTAQTALRLAHRIQRQVSEFRSKPVPNFSAHHKLWEKRNQIRQMNCKHKITAPETPQTLLTSMEAKKRWQVKKMKISRQVSKELTLQPNISKQSIQLWRKRPFLPRIRSSFVTTEPFQLRTEERAKQRRQFDEWNMQIQQARWREKYLEWRRLCKAEYLAARKLTKFKAQSNPWKRLKAKCIQDKN